MSKITVVGAGNVGATCADSIARHEICNEVILVDIKEGYAQGKALDIYQCSAIEYFDTRLAGSDGDYSLTADSDIVVISSGSPRKPGMSRDDLININADIVKTVTENVVKHSPNAIVIVVANPLDTMTYHAWRVSGLPPHRVFGMAGILDTARYRAFLAMELNVSPKDIQAMLLGGHGDTMVPLPRYTTISGIPLSEFGISDARLNEIIERTKMGGGEITKLLGTSAWYAPGTASAQMCEAILRDQKRIFPCCSLLQGEYGLQDICVGVPVILGRNGIEKIIQLNLNEAETKLLHDSAAAVRNMNQVIYPA
jgi:malate dehydrogenase